MVYHFCFDIDDFINRSLLHIYYKQLDYIYMSNPNMVMDQSEYKANHHGIIDMLELPLNIQELDLTWDKILVSGNQNKLEAQQRLQMQCDNQTDHH